MQIIFYSKNWLPFHYYQIKTVSHLSAHKLICLFYFLLIGRKVTAKHHIKYLCGHDVWCILFEWIGIARSRIV